MAVVGGTVSELTGGKFANGAVSGAFVHLFNAERGFKTLVQAAKRAIEMINPRSMAEHIEYAGTIYKDSQGKYGYTGPYKGTLAGSDPHINNIPKNTVAVGYYHTHGGIDPGYDNEHFSQADYDYANYYKIDAFVGTPWTKIDYYNYTSGKTITIY